MISSYFEFFSLKNIRFMGGEGKKVTDMSETIRCFFTPPYFVSPIFDQLISFGKHMFYIFCGVTFTFWQKTVVCKMLLLHFIYQRFHEKGSLSYLCALCTRAAGAAYQSYWDELMLLKCVLMLLKSQINSNTNKMLPTKCLEMLLKYSYLVSSFELINFLKQWF